MRRTFPLIALLLLLSCATAHAQTVITVPAELDFLGPMGNWILAKRFGGQVLLKKKKKITAQKTLVNHLKKRL